LPGCAPPLSLDSGVMFLFSVEFSIPFPMG